MSKPEKDFNCLKIKSVSWESDIDLWFFYKEVNIFFLLLFEICRKLI